MAAWLQHDWCSSFVLALGHFLWQGTLIALVLAIALRAVKAVSMRYWLSLAALLLMAACPAVTLGWLLQPARHVATLDPLPVAREEPAPSQPMIPAETIEAASDVGHVSNVPVNQPIAPLDFNTSATISPLTPADDRSWWQKFAPQLTTAYLCGVALMLMRLVIGLWGGRRLRRQVRLIDEPSLLAAMQRQATALGLKLLPVLAYCERVTVPTVVGVLKPMILLPLTLTSGLSPEQMESVLAHELAHLRRYDHLVNLLQRVIESLLFSHPAMWWVSHRIREEREHCCDDLVVACGAMPLDYAKSLLVVAELSRASQLRRSVAAVSLLATGDKPSNLRQRIARLLGESATPSLRLSPRVLAMSVTVLLIGLAMLIQLGMSNEQSSSDRDDERESVPAIANLPDGIAVELVGLTEMSAGETSWWKPNGDILTPSPKLAPQQRGTWKIGDIELRRVLIHVRGFKKDSMAVTANMSGSHVIEQLPSGESFLSWAGALQRPPAKHPTVVRVGVATEPLSPTRVLKANGQRRPQPANAPLDHIAEDIVVTKVRRLEGGKKQVAGKFVPIIETEVTYEMPAAWRQVDLQIVAIDKTGQTHHTSGGGGNLRDDANSKSPGQATGLAMFPLSPDEIDRFEYQFRLFRHWVTFENAAWNSEEHRKVRVITDSLPSPDNQKNGVGRGSPDPALDSTAGLLNSDEETDPTNNANGDQQSNPAAKSGDPRRAQAGDWGPTTNGLRARVIPVLSSMSDEAIDPAQRVTKFAKADDVAFVVELENVSDKPIKLVDLWHDAKNGKPIQDADWLSQFVCSVVLFDRDGKLIEQPDIEVGDAEFALHDAQLTILQPGKTQQFLIKTVRWLPLFKPQIHAGSYQVAVRYHWLSGPNATRIKETANPNSTLLEAAAVSVVSAGVAIEVGGESRKADLVWGQAINGLRAALSFEPSKATHTHGEKLVVNLHLQNVGTQPLKLVSDLSLQEANATIANNEGRRVALDESGGGLSPRMSGLLTLKPQQVVVLDAGELGLAISEEQASQIDERTMRKLIAPAGQYSMQLQTTFDNVLTQRVFVQGQEIVRVKDAWVGKLMTGAAPLTVNAETSPQVGLEFLKPYPKLHGLSLDMTEPQFLEIVKQQELKTRKTGDGEKVTHHIALGDGHTLIVMFDKDAKCSGIQRVRGDDEKGSDGPTELRVLRKPALLFPDHWIMQAVGFDNGGKELVTASNQSFITIRRWDVVGMKLISEIKLQGDKHGRAVHPGTFKLSGDRRRVVGATNAYVGIWDTATGKLLKQLPFPAKEGIYDSEIDRLDCTADLSVIVGHRAQVGRLTLSYDAHVLVWDGATGNALQTVIDKGATDLKAIDLSTDGKRLVTTNGSGAKIWETSTGKLLRSIPNDNTGRSHVRQNVGDVAQSPRSGERGYESHVWSVQFSPDGQQLAMGDILGVKLLDATSGKLLREMAGPYRYSSSSGPGLVFSPDGQRLVRLGTQEKAEGDKHRYVVPIWSTRTGARLFELHTEANDAAFSDDGQRLAVGLSDMQQALAVWTLSGEAEIGGARFHRAERVGNVLHVEQTAGPGPHSRQDRVEENGHYVGKTAAEFIDKFQPTWGEAKLGLQYGIALTKPQPQRKFRSGERVPLVVFFRNTSDKPIKFNTAPDFFGNTPKVLNAQGEPIALENIPLLGRIPHYHEKLAPGEALGPFYLNFGLGENPRPGQQHWHPYFKTPVAGQYKLMHSVSINVASPKDGEPSKRDDITTSTIEFEIFDGDKAAAAPRVQTELDTEKKTSTPDVVTIQSISLADVVRDFNAENKQLGQGLDQPALTEDEVIAVIKRDQWKPEISPINEKEMAAFKAVAGSKRLPKDSYLQVYTEDRADTFLSKQLWQVRLMLPSIGHDGFVGLTIRNTIVAEERIDPKQIAWGKPDADGLSLGLYLSPKKAQYAIGERVRMRLFVRNESKQQVKTTWANTSHPMPDDFTMIDDKGTTVAVHIGHKSWDRPWISGFVAGGLGAGDVHAFFVPYEILIGGNSSQNKLIGRVIDAHPGQKLLLKVRESIGSERERGKGEAAPESGSISFEVVASPKPAEAAREAGVQALPPLLEFRVAAQRPDSPLEPHVPTDFRSRTYPTNSVIARLTTTETGFVWVPVADGRNVISELPVERPEVSNVREALLADTPEHSIPWNGKWSIENCRVVSATSGNESETFSIELKLNATGGEAMKRLTKSHLNQPLAIVVNNLIVAAPIIRSEIGEHIVISGNFNRVQADKLAATLTNLVAHSQGERQKEDDWDKPNLRVPQATGDSGTPTRTPFPQGTSATSPSTIPATGGTGPIGEARYPIISQNAGELPEGWIACDFGLQYRVRAETTSLVAGELPLIFVDVRNRGTFKDMGLEMFQARHGVYVNGQRYFRSEQAWAGVTPLEPDGNTLTLAFALSDEWLREGELKTPLRLDQGKHRISVSMIVSPVYPSPFETQTTPASRQPIRRSLVCRPIEIEVRSGAWSGPTGSLGLENIRREVIAIPDFFAPKVPANLRRLVQEHQPAAGDFLITLVKPEDVTTSTDKAERADKAFPQTILQQSAAVTFADAWDSMNRQQIERYLLATMTHIIDQRPQYPQGIDAEIVMGTRNRPGFLGLPNDRKYSAKTQTTLQVDGQQFDQPIENSALGGRTHWLKTKDLSLGRHTVRLATKFTFTRGSETYRGDYESPEFTFDIVAADAPDDLIAAQDEDLDRLVRESLVIAETDHDLDYPPGSEQKTKTPSNVSDNEKWRHQMSWDGNKLGLASLHAPVWKLAKRLPVDLCFSVDFQIENTNTRMRCNDLVSSMVDGERRSYFSPKDFAPLADMVKHADKDGFVSGRLVLKPTRSAALTNPQVQRYYAGEITTQPLRFKVNFTHAEAAQRNSTSVTPPPAPSKSDEAGTKTTKPMTKAEAKLPQARPQAELGNEKTITPTSETTTSNGQSNALPKGMQQRLRSTASPDDGPTQPIYGVRFASDGALVTSSAGNARVWDIRSGKLQQTLPHQDKTTTVRGRATSPDGTLVVTSAFDDTVGVWERSTGKRLFTLKGHGDQGGIRIVRFKPDGSQFAAWGDDAVLCWWSTKDGTLAAAHTLDLPGYVADQTKRPPFGYGMTQAFAPDAKSLFVSFEGQLFEFDTSTGKQLRNAPIYRYTEPLVVSADGQWIATGEARRDEKGDVTSSAIVLRDRTTLKVVRKWPVSDPREAPANAADPNHKPPVSFVAQNDNGMAFSPDSKLLAWSRLGTRPGIDLVEVARDRLHASIPVESPCWCLEFSPNGSFIVSGHADSTACVWNRSHPVFVARPVARDGRWVPTNRTVRVQVVDSKDSTPLAGVVVDAERWEGAQQYQVDATATTDAKGFVEFKGLDAIHYRWDLTTEKPLPYIANARHSGPEEEDVVIKLPRACELILRAIDAETGQGIPGVLFGRERALAEYWLQDIEPDTIELTTEATWPVRRTDTPAGLAKVRAQQAKLAQLKERRSLVTDADGRYRCLVNSATWSYSVAKFPTGYDSIVPINGLQEVEIETPSGTRVEYTFKLRKATAK